MDSYTEIACSVSRICSCLFSSKQNLRIFSLFQLYSRIVLHATKCISRGLGSCSYGGDVSFWYFSVAIAKLRLRILVFDLLCVSVDILVDV